MKSRHIIAFLFCRSILLFGQTLVLPGDHPDPSVVKIGDSYWATATTSNWAPAYPLLESKDLITWTARGHVFPILPSWADYYFWAPEISYENDKVYVYYSAHKKDGNLCIAVASADKPEGPYTDHGPLMCEPVGSIDAFPMRDANGKLFLIWKEDGNSVQKPTPIWAMEMNEERTKLIGEKRELFRNEMPWEANLVEGVSIIKHNDYLYAFYAGAGCCGRDCNYAMGVARSKDLFGPWEKFEGNPLFSSNEKWKCPGHGTAVEMDGKYFMLYHAYSVDGDVYAGRQGVLKEFRFNNEDWIELVNADLTDTSVPKIVIDDFSQKSLSHQWQWSVFQHAECLIKNQKLQLRASENSSGTFIGQKILTDDYTARISVKSAKEKFMNGIAVIGDDRNLVAATLSENTIQLWQLKDEKLTVLKELTVEKSKWITFQVDCVGGGTLIFSYSTDGKNYKTINEKEIDGSYLPPWDRAIRVGVVSKGLNKYWGVFDDFVIEYHHDRK